MAINLTNTDLTTLFSLTLSLFITITIIIKIFTKSPSGHYKLTNWPVLGMSPTFIQKQALSNFHDFSTQLLKQCNHRTLCFKGPWFADHDFILTSDPANIHHILSKNFNNYPKGNHFNLVFNEAFGDGIFNSEGESWKNQRRILHSALKQSEFKSSLQKSLVEKINNGLCSILETALTQEKSIELQEIVKRFSFDIVFTSVIGWDPQCLEGDVGNLKAAKAYDVIEECLFYRHMRPHRVWRLKRLFGIGMEKEYKHALRAFDEFIYSSIQHKQNKEITDFGLLSAFLEEKPDDKYLRDITFNLLLAGRDTVSAALTWFFWLIYKNPFVENKIWDEIRTNLKAFNVDEVNKLVYLHAALCETLRLYPPVPFNHKSALESDVLPSGHKVDKNVRIFICSYPMGRMEELWGEDCLEFKPERWISEKGEVVHVPSYKFIAFNAGPRTCSGRDLSFVVMKMVVVGVMLRYKIEVEDGHVVKPKDSMVLQMERGLKVRVLKRLVDEEKED